jgi:hypothetical protein
MDIKNKTNRPLAIPLPRGKILHLGPKKKGQIAANAAEHPALKKLVEAGEIELADEHDNFSDEPPGAKTGGGERSGHGAAGPRRSSGDR